MFKQITATRIEAYCKIDWLTVKYVNGHGCRGGRWTDQTRVVARMFFLYVFDFQRGHDCRTTRVIAGPEWKKRKRNLIHGLESKIKRIHKNATVREHFESQVNIVTRRNRNFIQWAQKLSAAVMVNIWQAHNFRATKSIIIDQTFVF